MGTWADFIRAKFPLKSLANPTNAAIQQAFLGVDEDGNDLAISGRTVTGTSDGTGEQAVLSLEDGFLTINSGNANHIVMLPSVDGDDAGKEIWGWVGATAIEVRAAGTAATINGLDCKTTNEAALAATGMFCAKVVAAETWILRYWTELGAASTIVPDAV